MDKKKLAAAFNLWMQEYINHPEKFAHDWEVVTKHLAQVRKFEPVTYGDECAAYLETLLTEIG